MTYNIIPTTTTLTGFDGISFMIGNSRYDIYLIEWIKRTVRIFHFKKTSTLLTSSLLY